MVTDYAYDDVHRVVYGEGATFVPVCADCGRFVKAAETVRLSDAGLMPGPNATCKKCGRVEMLVEGSI